MIRPWLRTLAVTCVTAGLVGASASGAPPDDAAFVADTRVFLSKLEKLGFAGVVVVAREDGPVLAEGVGLADRERGLRWTPATVSTIGSITKQFTAAAILALEEQGRLRVDDPLTKHFSDVPDDKRAITLHQLLTHSSGIRDLEGADDWDPVGREAFVRRALAQPLAFTPGTSYEYTNANFSLLGAIVEQLTGTSWEQFARTRLFLPQGMYETGYIAPRWGDGRFAQGYRSGERWGTVLERPMADDGPYWVLRANGGVHAPAYDMLRWAEALMNGRVLSAPSMEKLWAPHVKEPGDTHYGYGWSIHQLGDTKVVTHNGGNGIHFADLAIVPAARTVVFLQTNVIADMPIGNRLLGLIGYRLLSGRPYPDIPSVVAVSEQDLHAFEGTYRLPDEMGTIRFAAAGGRLVAEAEGQRAFALLHSSRAVDEARVARLSATMETVLAAARRGDFGPMQRARGDDVPADVLARRHDEWRSEREAAMGRLMGHDVLGTALQEGRDITVVRFRFERGTADRAYVWDPGAETRLQGVSFRGLPTRLAFVPTGSGTFASWDGGLSGSRPATFAQGDDERMRVAYGHVGSQVTATR